VLRGEKAIPLAFVVMGCTATLGQTLLIRELLTVFYGNELALGAMFSGWLLWVAFGSILLGRLADRVRNRETLFGVSQVLVALIFPLQLVLVRFLRNLWHVWPGEMPSIDQMLVSSLVVFIPGGLVVGLQFALASRLYAGPDPSGERKASRAIGSVYLLESAGGMLGGLLYGSLLVRLLPSFVTLTWVILANSFSALLVMGAVRGSRLRLVSPAILVGVAALLLVSPVPGRLEEQTLRLQWAGSRLLEAKPTLYGTLVVAEQGGMRSLYDNGILAASLPDRLAAEEWVHLAFLQHPDPRRILMLGGGVGGSVSEALKYPVESVQYVELNPEVSSLASKYLPQADVRALQDPRVRTRHADGRQLLRMGEIQDVDVVLIALPDPYTAQINRYYTVDFFRRLNEVLTPDGVVALKITSGENYLSPRLAQFNASVLASVKSVFPHIVLVPGDRLFILASPSGDYLTDDSQTLARRLTERGIRTGYVDQYSLSARLYPERISFVSEALEHARGVRLNRDFRPISSYYDFVLWSSQFGSGLQQMLAALEQATVGRVLAALGAVVLLLAVFRFAIRRLRVPLVVGLLGFSGIVCELLLVFGFQILYGYVYHLIGVVVASFMLGLVAGTAFMNRLLSDLRRGARLLAGVCVAMGGYAVLIPALLTAMESGATPGWLVVSAVLLATLGGGFLVGFAFPLANSLQLGSSAQAGQTAGLLYGADLLGACAGSLLFSIYFLPLLGVWETSFVVAVLSLVGCVAML
jgi:spermidine synthase